MDFCRFGSESQKPTRFWVWNSFSKQKECQICKRKKVGKVFICSQTGKPHKQLSGVQANQFLTKSCEAYPERLAELIADILLS